MHWIRGLAHRPVARLAALMAAFALALAGPARAERINVGVLKLASSGPVFIAKERGYFRDEGLDAELRFFEAAQPIALAVVSGDVDVGITGLTAGFYNLAGKGALKIIAAQSREEPGYHLGAYIASRKAYEAGLKSLADLPGHSVGITQVGSTFHYSLGRLAEKLGFDLARIRLVPLQSMPNMVAALRGGQVDVALVPATVGLPAVARGEAVLLGWVGDETPWQVGAIFASPKTIATRRPALQAFLRAYEKGAQDFYDAFLAKGPDGKPAEGPGAQDVLGILAKYTDQDAAGLRAGIPYVDPKGRLLVGDIHHQVAWYKAQKLVDAGVDARNILDLSFVPDHFDVPK
jgi:NitT/TauT family transport system substrate-binding protein